jgi:hypothetical protein
MQKLATTTCLKMLWHKGVVYYLFMRRQFRLASNLYDIAAARFTIQQFNEELESLHRIIDMSDDNDNVPHLENMLIVFISVVITAVLVCFQYVVVERIIKWQYTFETAFF